MRPTQGIIVENIKGIKNSIAYSKTNPKVMGHMADLTDGLNTRISSGV